MTSAMYSAEEKKGFHVLTKLMNAIWSIIRDIHSISFHEIAEVNITNCTLDEIDYRT